MTVIIRNAQGNIKTFMEVNSGTVLEPGETLEEVALSFGSYARRLRLVVEGRCGELVQTTAGSGTIDVRVECPGEVSVALEINGFAETLPLVEGLATLTLSREVPGTFIITPADKTKYCAAGESVCIVEVLA